MIKTEKKNTSNLVQCKGLAYCFSRLQQELLAEVFRELEKKLAEKHDFEVGNIFIGEKINKYFLNNSK